MLAQGPHRVCRLNDNLDGTFSVVGHKPGTSPAVVVSRIPMDSEPIADPHVPIYPWNCKTAIWVRAGTDDASSKWDPASGFSDVDLISAPGDQPDIETRPTGLKRRKEAQVQSPIAKSSPSVEGSGASRDGAPSLWNYVCSRIKGQKPSRPMIPEFDALLSLPKVRDLVVNHAFQLAPDSHPKIIAGLIIQVTGDVNRRSCTECRRLGNDAPFDLCVSASTEAVSRIFPFMGSSSRACANCIIRKNYSACSVKNQYQLSNLKSSLSTQHPSSSPAPADADDAASEDVPRRWRSSRRSLLAIVDGQEDGAEDESLVDASAESRRKIVAPKVSDHGDASRTTRPPKRRRVEEWASDVPEDVLRMEDWEVDDGQIVATSDAGGGSE